MDNNNDLMKKSVSNTLVTVTSNNSLPINWCTNIYFSDKTRYRIYGLYLLFVGMLFFWISVGCISFAYDYKEFGSALIIAGLVSVLFLPSIVYCTYKYNRIAYAYKLSIKLSKIKEPYVIIDIETMKKIHASVIEGCLKNCTTIFYGHIPYLVLYGNKYKITCPHCAAPVQDITNPFYMCEYCKNNVVKEIYLKDIN